MQTFCGIQWYQLNEEAISQTVNVFFKHVNKEGFVVWFWLPCQIIKNRSYHVKYLNGLIRCHNPVPKGALLSYDRHDAYSFLWKWGSVTVNHQCLKKTGGK